MSGFAPIVSAMRLSGTNHIAATRRYGTNERLPLRSEPIAEAMRGEFPLPPATCTILHAMRNEFTAIIQQSEGWYLAFSPEMPAASGQGRTRAQALESLSSATTLSLKTCAKNPSPASRPAPSGPW